MTAEKKTTPEPGTAPRPTPAELCLRASELAREAGSSLRRLNITSGDTTVELEWATEEARPTTSAPDAAEAAVRTASAPEDEGLWYVTAPMVGTFYHASEPGAAPFVAPGDPVEKGRTVGILEAMKLMNPIEADVQGTVAEVLVPNGEAVDYGRPLIAVVPEQAR